MIAPPPDQKTWHFDDGRGGALCGYAGAVRVTEPLERRQLIFASRTGVCPDCWQEFWTGRLVRPHYWYEEQDAMPTTTKGKQRKQRAKKQRAQTIQETPLGEAVPADTDGGDGEGLRGKYGLNEHGVFAKPEVVEIALAKSHRSKIKMWLAEDDDGGWHWGVDLAMPDSGHGFLPSLDSKSYPSRALALEMALMHATAWMDEQIERADTTPAARKAIVAATKAIAAMLAKVRAGLNSGRGGRHFVEAQTQLPPGATSTTTPAGIAAIDPSAGPPSHFLASVKMDQLERHPANRHPTDEAITECAASLEATGQLEPLVVRSVGERYQILSGETRFLAAQRLGWDAINVRFWNVPDDVALRLVAEYNSHRSDLNAIERARLIEQLCQPAAEGGGGLTREQAARSVGLESASAASNLVRLLELPDVWQERVAAGLLPQTYARVLLSVAATEPTVWHHAEETWHTWHTRGDVDRFAAFMQGRLPGDPGDDADADDSDDEPFPEKVEAVGSAPATTEPAADAASAAADDWEPEAADTTADDEPDGDIDADDEEVLDDDEPASVASEVPVQISERLRGAVDEWQYDWLSNLVQEALAEDEDACWRLSLWLLSLREDWIIGHVGKLWGEAADVDPLASPLECWRVCADRSDYSLRVLTRELCEQVLGLRLLDQDMLADLANMLELRLADCWRQLLYGGGENEQRLQAFYALHTAGELAALGRMVGVDVAQHRGKPARINALLSQAIRIPPYLRDWSAA